MKAWLFRICAMIVLCVVVGAWNPLVGVGRIAYSVMSDGGLSVFVLAIYVGFIWLLSYGLEGE